MILKRTVVKYVDASCKLIGISEDNYFEPDKEAMAFFIQTFYGQQNLATLLFEPEKLRKELSGKYMDY